MFGILFFKMILSSIFHRMKIVRDAIKKSKKSFKSILKSNLYCIFINFLRDLIVNFLSFSENMVREAIFLILFSILSMGK